MPSLPIRWILARTYGQATEDESRVAAALDAAVGGGVPSEDRLTGQFGNPVVVLSRRLESSEAVRAAWTRWIQAGIVNVLGTDLDSRIDEDGVLHFRLDKQRACEGQLMLHGDADTIDIQVKLKAYPAKPEEFRRAGRVLVGEAV